MFKQKLPKDWREDMKADHDIKKLSEIIKNFTADKAESSEKKIRI
jgi:hypothetical protein